MDLDRLLKLYRATYDMSFRDIADALGMSYQRFINVRRGRSELTVREFVVLWDLLRGLDATLTFEAMLEALPAVNRRGTWAERVAKTREVPQATVKATYHRDGERFVRRT